MFWTLCRRSVYGCAEVNRAHEDDCEKIPQAWRDPFQSPQEDAGMEVSDTGRSSKSAPFGSPHDASREHLASFEPRDSYQKAQVRAYDEAAGLAHGVSYHDTSDFEAPRAYAHAYCADGRCAGMGSLPWASAVPRSEVSVC